MKSFLPPNKSNLLIQKFVIPAFNIDSEIFIVYIAIQMQEKISVYLEKKIQIKAQGGAKNKNQGKT